MVAGVVLCGPRRGGLDGRPTGTYERLMARFLARTHAADRAGMVALGPDQYAV
ncbi:hypothetical protein [Nocardioides mangrovi]|uniref:Uncharacterized protein n=1 Tax=Nocardioides mangrovi TaxID=2874580 RepID=A0ABS7U7T6_9ACTN|nr:hypothetical protein [Nocardioides mangrovi]MBZ5737033.1 hypothetical protein [Nocardioides mangrovi]